MNEISRIDDFIAEKTLARTTETNYRRYLSRTFEWIDQCNLDFQTITVRQVKDWMDREKFGNSAAHQLAVVLRQFAVWRYGESHPLTRLKVKHIEAPPQRTLTPKEVDRVFKFLETPGSAECSEKLFNDRLMWKARRVRNLTIFSLFLDTGLRASELVNAELDNLHMEERYLQIFGKGRKWRKVIFSKSTAANLAEWLEIRKNYSCLGVRTVFISIGGKTPGEKLTRWGILTTLKRICRHAGIDGVSPHALRRSFATISIQNGAPTRLVQLQGGWSNLAMVERYTRKLEVDAFDRFFVTERMG